MTLFKKILLIDDDQNLRITLAMIFSRVGYRVTAVPEVGLAFQYLHDCSYDLVLLDLMISAADEKDICSKINLLAPDLPVVVLTTHSQIEIQHRCEAVAARDYLVKPIDPDSILSCVNNILNNLSVRH
jgi:DNA-binding response OmpR family regulator